MAEDSEDYNEVAETDGEPENEEPEFEGEAPEYDDEAPESDDEEKGEILEESEPEGDKFYSRFQTI